MILAIDINRDETIQRNVLEELHFSLDVKPNDIGVEVNDGIVMLSGTVSSYHQKWKVEHAALRVYGVRGTVNNLEVAIAPAELTSDEAIAHAAARAVEWDTAIPNGRVKVRVHDGRVILEGVVERHAEKVAVERAARHLPGVRDVANLVEIDASQGPVADPDRVKLQIERAFMRNAEIDARRIEVAIHGSYVTLAGHARTWVEREAAARAAWCIPGVTRVDNQIRVIP